MNVSASKKPSAASKSPFGRDGGKSAGHKRQPKVGQPGRERVFERHNRR
tara:strand:+ start:801 stop:947 length:147 start_codon:yes stop_codon:yes gene_type:complete